MSQSEHLAHLISLVETSPEFMQALAAVRELKLSSWCVGAGAVRNLVWDALHQRSTPSELADIDVVYFDRDDVSPERDERLRKRLQAALPGIPWEVTNQAGVHLWFEAYFGHAVAPLQGLEEAVASWPEFATAVGVWLADDNQVRVVTPHGLQDLFGMIVRRNPQRVSVETYRQRVAQKAYTVRWPMVRVVSC